MYTDAAYDKKVDFYSGAHLNALKLCQCNNNQCPNLHLIALALILFFLLEMKLLYSLYRSYLNKLNYMPIIEAE